MITMAIDPGKQVTITFCDSKTGNLIDSYSLKMDYKMEILKRFILLKKEFTSLLVSIFDKTMNVFDIDKILIEVPYSVGNNSVAYIFNRENKNSFDIVKLMSSIFAIYDSIASFSLLKDVNLITVPATYWLNSKETFEYKKQCCFDLIDFDKWKISKNNDHILDMTLLSYRFNNNYTLQHRVNCFMTADFSNKKKK